MTETQQVARELMTWARAHDLVSTLHQGGVRWVRVLADAPSSGLMGGCVVPDLDDWATTGVLLGLLPRHWSAGHDRASSWVALYAPDNLHFGPSLGVAAARALMAGR